MASKKKFNLDSLEEDMVGVISGVAKQQSAPAPAPAPAPEVPEIPVQPQVVYVEVPKRRTEDPRVAFGVSLKSSLKKKVEMSAVVKRTNTSKIIADALEEYFERHGDVLAKYEKMEQLGLLD